MLPFFFCPVIICLSGGYQTHLYGHKKKTELFCYCCYIIYLFAYYFVMYLYFVFLCDTMTIVIWGGYKNNEWPGHLPPPPIVYPERSIHTDTILYICSIIISTSNSNNNNSTEIQLTQVTIQFMALQFYLQRPPGDTY